MSEVEKWIDAAGVWIATFLNSETGGMLLLGAVALLFMYIYFND